MITRKTKICGECQYFDPATDTCNKTKKPRVWDEGACNKAKFDPVLSMAIGERRKQ